MHNKWWVGLALAALMSASAWAGDAVAIRASVPFDFMAGNQRVPAGEYVFAQDWFRRQLQIGSTDAKVTLSIVFNAGSYNRTGFASALVFDRYGDRYFLREVLAGENAVGARLPKSRAEKEEMVRNAPVQVRLTAAAAR
ncbi:MAG: hypothetical protein HY822_10530 [Acidobacteria bacterium]|nr:hypothetical protein [Acidobacteriota bacterium]